MTLSPIHHFTLHPEMKIHVLISLLLLATSPVLAETDSSKRSHVIEETVVTATRTERKMGNAAVPVTLISKKAIEASGALRLDDILQQQTGMVVNSGSGSMAIGGGIFGNGIQLQGLSADYTLVLVDGEPMIGRQGGVLDLSRFALGNVKKIEIVKGPSSCLYGSEAMGGVINLITEENIGNKLQANLRYGSYQLIDGSLQGGYQYKKSSYYGYVNRSSSQGYDLDPSSKEKTVNPHYNYTGQIRTKHQLTNKTILLLNGRYDFGNHKSAYAIGSKDINITGNSLMNSINLHPTLKHYFSQKLKTTLRLQGSWYGFEQNLDSLHNGKNYYSDYFKQSFIRAENQTDYQLNDQHQMIVGGGYINQTASTNRYSGIKTQHLYYAYLQDEYEVNDQWQVIGGVRYDHSSAYAGHVSPKLAILYKLSSKWAINASYGSGFKAPDFRQLYLDFINNAASGYAIYGASEFSMEKLEQQKAAGIIGDILPEAFSIKELKPETSNGFNLGARYNDFQKLSGDVNLFYNRINQLINYIPVAINNNGTQVFSYVNIAKAMTAGAELNLCYQLHNNWKIQGGYQYLFTADIDILKNVLNGKVYGREAPNEGAKRMYLSDYSGLLNRSKHMANLRVTYDAPEHKITGSVFASYRSKWGVTDIDGNGFANMDKEFANGYVQLNLTTGYKLNQHWKVQGGINNFFNYTDAINLPVSPGRNFFLSIQYSTP